MNDDKKIMSIFAQAYQLIAQASKQQPSLEGFLLILEILGEDGIQECAKVADLGPEAVAQAMIQIIQLKLTQKAANGAKLRYLLLLKGVCPPGYLKNGGRCKKCEKEAASNKTNSFSGGGDFDKLKILKNKNNKQYDMSIKEAQNMIQSLRNYKNVFSSAPIISYSNGIMSLFYPNDKKNPYRVGRVDDFSAEKRYRGNNDTVMPEPVLNKQQGNNDKPIDVGTPNYFGPPKQIGKGLLRYNLGLKSNQQSGQKSFEPQRTERPIFPNPIQLDQHLHPMSLYKGYEPPYPYPYIITREIYEPQIPGFMPGIQGYPRHYNGGALKFQGGGFAKAGYIAGKAIKKKEQPLYYYYRGNNGEEWISDSEEFGQYPELALMFRTTNRDGSHTYTEFGPTPELSKTIPRRKTAEYDQRWNDYYRRSIRKNASDNY